MANPNPPSHNPLYQSLTVTRMGEAQRLMALLEEWGVPYHIRNDRVQNLTGYMNLPDYLDGVIEFQIPSQSYQAVYEAYQTGQLPFLELSECPACGQNLSGRELECPGCGLSLY